MPSPLINRRVLLSAAKAGSALIRSNLIAEYRNNTGSGTTIPNAVTGNGGDLMFQGSPTWVATGVDFTGAPVSSKWAQGAFTGEVTLTTMTAYVVFKWATGDNPDNGGNNYLSGLLSGGLGTTFRLLPNYNAAGASSFWFNDWDTVAVQDNCHDGKWHVLAGVYDDATVKVYLDDVLLATRAANVGNVTLENVYMAGLTAAGYAMPVIVGYALIYDTHHTTTQIRANRAALEAIMSARGASMPVHENVYMLVGDSIPLAGKSQIYAGQTGKKIGICRAVAGTTISNFVTDAANVDDYVNASRENCLVVWGGGNSLGGTMTEAAVLAVVAEMKAYCLARRAAGWDKIVLVNLLPRTTAGYNTNRAIYNAAVLADPSFYEQLADVAGDATIGEDADASNATYYSDGVHPTTAGHNIAGPIIGAAIDA